MTILTDAIIRKQIDYALSIIRGDTRLLYVYKSAYSAIFTNLLETAVTETYNDGSPKREIIGCTPLHLAACYSDLILIVRALIQAKVQLNPLIRRNDKEHNVTPLHLALIHGNDEIACELIDAGADVNEYCEMHPKINGRVQGWCFVGEDLHYSPLYIALVTCKLDTIKKLIAKGAKVHDGICGKIKGTNHFQAILGTTLLNAIRTLGDDQVEIIELLLSSGAKVDQFTYCGIHIFTSKNRFKLIENPNNYPIQPYHSALSLALYCNKPKIAAALLRHGAKITQILELDHDIYSAFNFVATDILGTDYGEFVYKYALSIDLMRTALQVAHEYHIQIPQNELQQINAIINGNSYIDPNYEEQEYDCWNTDLGKYITSLGLKEEFDSLALPDWALCPIMLCFMFDPVTLGNTGHTFDRPGITTHLNLFPTDPLTGLAITNTTLAPNFTLRDSLKDHFKQLAENKQKAAAAADDENAGRKRPKKKAD